MIFVNFKKSIYLIKWMDTLQVKGKHKVFLSLKPKHSFLYQYENAAYHSPESDMLEIWTLTEDLSFYVCWGSALSLARTP